jgi:hypothetical protein
MEITVVVICKRLDASVVAGVDIFSFDPEREYDAVPCAVKVYSQSCFFQ